MNGLEKFKENYKWVFFGILTAVITTPLLTLLAQLVSNETKITDKIYSLNGFLWWISLLAILVYFIGIYVLKPDETYSKYKRNKKEKNGIDIKALLKKNWPCLLLAVFMCWTAVGCIQASMEAGAEAALRDDIAENDTERNKEIAAWTEGDRMQNAADRSWNGCDNLKDGYWSFMFYGMVLIDVVMLGANSDKQKKYLLRIFLVTSIILTFITLCNFLNVMFLGDIVYYRRSIFNNSNHYGYYLCISVILSAMMFLKDDKLYFKGIALIGFILMMFELIINNTFGAYLGVLTSIIIITLCVLGNSLINIVKNKKIKAVNMTNVAKVITLSIIFTMLSASIAGNQIVQAKLGENIIGIYPELFLKIGNSDYILSYNARDGVFLKGTDEVRKPVIQGNFEQTLNDVNTIFSSFKNKDSEQTNDETKEELAKKQETENKSGLSEEVSKTGSGRGEVWLTSLKLIKQRPLFGWGLENMLNEFYSQYGVNEGRTHNLILQLAGTTGIVGVLLYMVAVIAIFFKVLFNYKKWGIVEYVTVPIFIAYMVSSMFGNSAFYTSPHFMVMFGMMVAFMIFSGNNSEEKSEKTK